MTLRLTFLTILLLFAQLSALGDTVYDNGPFNITGSSTALSINGARTADDFVLASPARVDAIRFWLGSGSAGDFGGVVSYAIYQDSAGSLGSVIASGSRTAAVTIVTVPFNFSDVPQIDFTLASPVLLPAGAYWLELHKGFTLTTRDGASVFWLTRAGVTGNAKMDGIPTLPSSNRGYELGFQLSGAAAAIPEPTGALVVLSGLGALALLRKRCWR